MPRPPEIPRPDPIAVSEWLRSLPLGNADAAHRSIMAALEGFTAYTVLPGETRFKITELVARPIELLSEGFTAPLTENSLPYRPEIERRGFAARDLHLALTKSHILALQDFPTESAASAGMTWGASATSQALANAGQALLISSQLYRSLDSAFWRDVYLIYETWEPLAARRSAPPEPLDNPDPIDEFKRILLFALVNPFRLRQREMAALFAELQHLAPGVDIRKSRPESDILPEFCFNPISARPPVRFAAQGNNPGDVRYLYTRRVARALLKGAGGEMLPPGLATFSRSLLIRVARSVGGIEKRKFSRIQEHNVCRMFVGLQELADAFRDPRRFDDRAETGAATGPKKVDWSIGGFELIPKESAGSWSADDADTRAFRNEATLDQFLLGNPDESGATSADEIWQSAGNAPHKSGPAHGEIVNSGPQGYCITWKQGPGPWIRAGELIAIAIQSTQPFLGVIRWLTVLTSGPLQFGVELLTPQADAVDILGPNGKHQGFGLLLPADPVLRSEPELVLPASGFRPKSVIVLGIKGRPTPVRLGELLEATPAFTRFSGAPIAGGALC